MLPQKKFNPYKNTSNIQSENSYNNDKHKKTNKSNNSFINDKENYLFDLFGIKLYYDDILILCLLFCLYKEDVKDYNLFIALLLLLIS
jgi:hypothetical protein